MANVTLQSELDDANPGTVADCLRQVKLGTMLTPLKFDTGVISSSTSIILSPPALLVGTCRVVSGAAAAGARTMSDMGDTPTATVATLSDDGTTITFEAGVTEAVVEYIPRSATAMDTLEQPAS